MSLGKNFNPRSRKGSDSDEIQSQHEISEISIHAPARGATRIGVCTRAVPSDFNPRSRKGSDHYIPDNFILRKNFNPRSRKGSDASNSCNKHVVLLISIHAPARGATRTASFLKFTLLHFNPRSRKGSDTHRKMMMVTLMIFQSTLPQGERLNDKTTLDGIADISIHAPARGATSARRKPARNTDDFNPRSRKGSDKLAAYEDLGYTPISIHAPARGATKSTRLTTLSTGCYFNPRSRKGSDSNRG